MGEKLVIGPINKGLRTDRTPFVIDNDNFPTLINAYQWRGRIKRKRGTKFLGRLTRGLVLQNVGNVPVGGMISIDLKMVLGLETTASIVPGSISFNVGSFNIIEVTPINGQLKQNFGAGSILGAINYSTGLLTYTANPLLAGTAMTITFSYYPNLPVMGLEDFSPIPTQDPGTIAFDTTYSYNISTADPFPIWDVSFYKNPASSGTFVQKTTWTSTTWNGKDYQQFWTVNYEGALWATNGVDVKFTGATIGMQFAPASSITYVSNTATTLVVTISGSPLVIGDFVFANEWGGANASTLNFQTGYVTNITGPNITITFPNATLGAGPYTPGILQYLTNRSNVNVDNIRWYDGDPTGGAPPTPSSTFGWVNFMPPLSQGLFSIADLPQAQYYLVGAKMIFPFKDRLLFIGPVVQTSTGSPQYLQDTVIYSQNGTPYYTASFTGLPVSANTVFNPLLVPNNQTASAASWFEDQIGFGGFQSAAVGQPINTVSANEDALIMGFSNLQTRFVYTGNDIIPFNFFIVNSELGSSSTFSIINMDQGILTRGNRGFVITAQTNTKRFDLDIPDQVFEIQLADNGTERFTAQRDFINEWVYFTYTTNLDSTVLSKFPNQTLQYNYRDDSWAIFNESYTTYGQFRISSGRTWLTIKTPWNAWTDPWNSGSGTLLQPKVIGGNQQGFILFRDEGTSEEESLEIQAISGSTITSPNHGLNVNDYIIISGAIGTNVNLINNLIFSIATIIDANNFTLNPSIAGTITYIGGGVITRMYVPYIQTKQFPTAWQYSRKTRLGPQQYLLSQTPNAQITLLIFLSQDDDNAWNDSSIVPDVNSVNNSLIYSTILYTCRESTNLGLTPANTNLQQLNSISSNGSSTNQQQQIWHRINTSLIGDTVQLGFTMSDAQMRAVDEGGNPISQFEEIEIHSIILDINPSQMLS